MAKKKNTKRLNKIKEIVNTTSEKRYQKEKNKKKLKNLTFEERLHLNTASKYKIQPQYDNPSTSSADSYLNYTRKLTKQKNNRIPTFVGPIPASWKQNANTSKYKAEPYKINEKLSLKNICIKKIACSIENEKVIRNFQYLPVHLKELIMNRIPIYNSQITNEILINLFLESGFSHLHLVHSVVTFPVLSTILKIRYITKHHTSNTTTIDTKNNISNSNSNSNSIMELTNYNINNKEKEEEITPRDSWEDIYDSSDEESQQIQEIKVEEEQEEEEEEEIYVENENLKIKEEIKILEKKFKKHLTLSQSHQSIETFKGFRNLTSLDISYCSFLSPKMIPLVQILGEYVPNLKYLNISGTLIEYNGHNVLFMISHLLKHLNFLLLNDISWLENEDLTTLSWTSHFKHLIQLQLKLCPLLNQSLLINYFNLHRPAILIEF
ncbi:hypothetical protein BCR36DRAFT_348884 [Piromyces finnis]|uniref:RNI-like protein n=1 Tax=Piromyces finnis TaxID=1754191 RepID=A0A1Y1VE50_9FUNG|nr:hypothetical protein BCR36DRAFT_348884 [Piromyces finnis]|eukprot:ORX53857.1 hypothetical protein BCR36DRAFT_348884 [Piromyces finnis]